MYKSISKQKKRKEVICYPARQHPELIEAMAKLLAFHHKYHLTVTGMANMLGISRQSFGEQVAKYEELL